MVLGRSSLLAVSLLFVATAATAETKGGSSERGSSDGGSSDGGPSERGPSDGRAKVNVNLGVAAATAKSDVKSEIKVEAAAKTDASGKSVAPTSGDKTARRDPKGKKGISPFWEAIRRGDEAALARDFSRAEQAYQAALSLDANHPLAHFRRGQILVRWGKLTDAEAVYQDALRLSDKDPTQHAAALFVLADLKERQGQRDAAMAAWKAYAEYLKAVPEAKGYPETPADREQRIKKYNELIVSGKAVAERIQLRVKEVDEANRRAAAKNPNQSK